MAGCEEILGCISKIGEAEISEPEREEGRIECEGLEASCGTIRGRVRGRDVNVL
jgi:hypothetical protein